MRNREAFNFFREHAGWSTPPGKLKCAKTLAEAEAFGQELGLEVRWVQDEAPDLSWVDAKTLKRIEDGTLEVLCAYVQDEAGEVLASLGGVVVGKRDPYMRVVEAELLSEALHALKRGGV